MYPSLLFYKNYKLKKNLGVLKGNKFPCDKYIWVLSENSKELENNDSLSH